MEAQPRPASSQRSDATVAEQLGLSGMTAPRHRVSLVALIALSAVLAPTTVVEAAPLQSVVNSVRVPCTAHMSNSRPHQRSTVYVRVSSWGGANVTTTASYKTTRTVKHGVTNRQTGRVSIEYRISTATIGYRVTVDVIVRKGGNIGMCATSFIPQ